MMLNGIAWYLQLVLVIIMSIWQVPELLHHTQTVADVFRWDKVLRYLDTAVKIPHLPIKQTHTHTPEIKMKQVSALMTPRGNTAAHIRLSMPKYVPPKCLFQWRSWPAPNSWFFRLTGVNTPNGTSMGPAVISVGSRLSPTDTQTTDISKTVRWI